MTLPIIAIHTDKDSLASLCKSIIICHCDLTI